MSSEHKVFTSSELDGFHYDERPDYLIFDPQSLDERKRLGQLLGATERWRATQEKLLSRLPADDFLYSFAEQQIVGSTETGEFIAMVFVCTIIRHEEVGEMTGEWFCLQFAAGAESRIEADVQAALGERIRRVDQALQRSGSS